MSVELALPQSRSPAVEKNEYEMSVELVFPQSRNGLLVCGFALKEQRIYVLFS